MGFTARARAAALAAVVAGTLVTGAVSAGGQHAQAAGSAAQDGTKARAKAKPPATVTLITGDRGDRRLHRIDTRGVEGAQHPATAKAVSFRVDLKDTGGNTMRETITNAYRLAP
ncbi:hypothetical protein AB0C70_15740 [Streptomyces sp. NPDC048564]|uniref:hypothetical protein n=1 Tax=unclassified Streptomyces TaxID=2593676 RepID=UPI003404B3F4